MVRVWICRRPFFFFRQFLTQNVTDRMVGVVRLQRQGVQTSISPWASLPHQAFSETVYFIDYSSVQHWIPSILKQLGEWVSDSNFSAHTPLKCEVESFSLFSTGTKLNHLRCQRCVLLPVTRRSLSFPCARFSVSSSVFMVIILVLALWLVAPSPVCHSDVSPLLHFFTPLVRQL